MFCLIFLGEVNPPVGDGERITVCLVGGFAGRKLNDPRSAFGYASEPVDGLAFATHTPVVAAKADLVRVGLALTKEDKEGRGVRLFHFHVVTIPQPELKVKFFFCVYAIFFLSNNLCKSLVINELWRGGGPRAVTP